MLSDGAGVAATIGTTAAALRLLQLRGSDADTAALTPSNTAR